MYINQNELVDAYMDATIINCHIHRKASTIMEIIVTYDDGYRERIWTYNPTKYVFDYHKFIGMSKLEAIFYCDRKEPRRI